MQRQNAPAKDLDDKYKFSLMNLLIHDRLTSGTDLRTSIIQLMYQGSTGYADSEINELEDSVTVAYGFDSGECYTCQICGDDVLEPTFREHAKQHNPNASSVPYDVLSRIYDQSDTIKPLVSDYLTKNGVPDYVGSVK
jgi:hypothetical protein